MSFRRFLLVRLNASAEDGISPNPVQHSTDNQESTEENRGKSPFWGNNYFHDVNFVV
jgi:hypothetical protein